MRDGHCAMYKKKRIKRKSKVKKEEGGDERKVSKREREERGRKRKTSL